MHKSNGGKSPKRLVHPDRLNRYSSRTVPGAVDVLGVAKATASVTVNSAAAYEKDEYFCKEVSVSNGSGPAYQSVSVTATEGANNTNQTGNILVPPATQTFLHDADGNLTNDSLWSCTWDGENRLKQMTNLTTVSTSARKKLVFTYDFIGRRITKKVYPWSGGNYSTTPETDLEFLYDGWNLIAELNATNNAVIRGYIWGQDLSGTMGKAGGIGGLLLVTEHFATPTNHFVTYDGNGNVVALVNGANSSIGARYEYSPFGELLRQTGPLAARNPFRWSTKFCDYETGLTCYGYRYYNSSLGRWLSKDPIAEAGGNNLYQFCVNAPTIKIDRLGETPLNLGDGWSGRVDTFDYRGEGTFEIHIYDPQGNERGVFGPDGWINKHGHKGSIPDDIVPEHVFNKVRGEAIERLREGRKLPERGTANIKGVLKNTGGANIKLVGALAIINAIMLVAEGDSLAATFAADAQSYFRNTVAGETAYADLDAISLTLDVQNIVGDNFISYSVLGGLLQ